MGNCNAHMIINPHLRQDIAFARYVKQDYVGAIAKLRDMERYQTPLELDSLILLAECLLHSTKLKAAMSTIDDILRCLKSFSTTQLFFWGRLLDTPSHRIGWMIVHAAMAQNVDKFASCDEYSDMVLSLINSVGWKGYHMLTFGSRYTPSKKSIIYTQKMHTNNEPNSE